MLQGVVLQEGCGYGRFDRLALEGLDYRLEFFILLEGLPDLLGKVVMEGGSVMARIFRSGCLDRASVTIFCFPGMLTILKSKSCILPNHLTCLAFKFGWFFKCVRVAWSEYIVKGHPCR